MPAKRAKSKTKPKSNARAKLKTKAQAASKSSVGAAKVKDKAKEQRELGYKTAVSLIAEIILPDGVTPPKKLQILDEVKVDPRFFESKKGGVTSFLTKNALLEAMGCDIDSARIFCYISLETNIRKAFDIDHVCPREYFVKKQQLLLAHLNQYSDFAKGFLGEENLGSEYQKKISQYFVRDKTSAQIKATKWFCEAAYNSISNLTFLLHYVNRDKRDMLPGLWFGSQDVTSSFKEGLFKDGGVSEGIIMQGVIKGDKEKIEQFVLYDTEEKSSITVYAHQGNYVGLGEYIRQWFEANKKNIIKAADKVFNIKKQLNEMLRDEMNDEKSAPGVKLKNILLMINEVFEVAQIRKILGQGGSSSSDSSLTVEDRIQGIRGVISEALNYMSMVKRVKKLIAASIAADYLDTYNKEFYRLFREKGFARLQEESLERAYKLVQEKFGEDSEKRPKDWRSEQFLGFVDGLIDEVDPLKKALRETAEERARREAAEHKVEAAEHKVEAAEHKAEAAEHKAEAAEKENAWLRALLASRGVEMLVEAPTADVAQMATPISVTTVRRPIRRAAQLAGLSQQQITATTPSGELQKRGRRGDSTGGSAEAATVAMAPPAKRQAPATRV